MGDTSERSQEPSLPPRCSCGFWGSSETMNLCSKCFDDIQKKPPGEDCPSKPIQSTGSSQSTVFSSETSSSSSQSLSSSPPPPPSSAEQPPTEEPSPTFPSMREGMSSTETAQGTLSTPTKRPRESASGSESEATPEKRPRTDEQEESGEEEARGTPKQKNRRRCYRCQTKLELVQQELGSCRCGYVFCMLHRLPEQHDCLFDHLGRGREEAVLKMVKLDRKVGRSCQRIGEECS
ncbi:AN1-type zinc finger protein 3 homolog [Sebastes fasciatus]|uniref:AN1-type zinc finger protein 3 homolog n=1 Tax=Sebastes fasciatus TaxID=394691 RepID=UPI003D9F21BF